AEAAFRNGLAEYDRRHGWRGPLAHHNTPAEAQAALAGMAEPPGIGTWQLAAVTAIDVGGATVALENGAGGRVAPDALRWARRTGQDERVGAPVRQVKDVLTPGDIVLVEAVAAAPAATRSRNPPPPAAPQFALRQIPDIGGGVVAMDPKNGRVFALV